MTESKYRRYASIFRCATGSDAVNLTDLRLRRNLPVYNSWDFNLSFRLKGADASLQQPRAPGFGIQVCE